MTETLVGSLGVPVIDHSPGEDSEIWRCFLVVGDLGKQFSGLAGARELLYDPLKQGVSGVQLP